MQAVWPESFVEEANLTVSISALRKALGEKEWIARHIETVSKKGYRFVTPVREVPLPPEHAPANILEAVPQAASAEENHPAEIRGELSALPTAQPPSHPIRKPHRQPKFRLQRRCA